VETKAHADRVRGDFISFENEVFPITLSLERVNETNGFLRVKEPNWALSPRVSIKEIKNNEEYGL